MKRQATIEDLDGEKCARVPLGNKGKHGTCVLNKDDYERLLFRRYPPNWRLSNGNVILSQAGNDNVPVARLVADAGDGERVQFKNGDKRDLRRTNLILVQGKGGAKRGASERGGQRLHKVDARLLDSSELSAFFGVEIPIKSSRKVQRQNREWFDQADGVAVEIRDWLAQQAARPDSVLPTWGKRYPQWEAPALNKEICRWPRAGRKEEVK